MGGEAHSENSLRDLGQGVKIPPYDAFKSEQIQKNPGCLGSRRFSQNGQELHSLEKGEEK